MLFDLENKNREEIVGMFNETLGKTKLCLQREALEAKYSTAGFGDDYPRYTFALKLIILYSSQCICEIQGQQPCTSLVKAPDYL